MPTTPDPWSNHRSAPPSPSIDDYRPPSNGWAWVAVVGVVTVAAAIAIFASFTSPQPTSTPTARVTSAEPTSTSGGMPFTSPTDGATGEWSLESSEWRPDGLQVVVRLSCSKGSLDYALYAFANNSATIFTPDSSGSGTLRSGDDVVVKLKFAMPRTNTTLVLANTSRKQISALAIKA